MGNHQDAARHWIVTTTLAYLGTPYVWGGDDPSGFDCSGLVIEALRSIGLVENTDLTADGLMNRFRSCEVTEPAEGCLVFFLNARGKALHVGICLDRWHMIEAGGGDNKVQDEAGAWLRNAFVKIRPLPSLGLQRRFCDPVLTIKE
jgi:D-gamma-glutamyl-meso-diaminopimelic acid endopeptidase CwlS